MKIEIASDVEEFFDEVSGRTTDVEIYANYLLEIASIIESSNDKNSIDFHMHNIINETDKFTKTREILSAKTIEVHRFKGRYSVMLASTWGVDNELDKAIDAFRNITSAMWFPTPLIYQDTQDKAAVFMRQINVEECQKYITIFENNYSVVSGKTGSLRGRLIASITGMNFPFIITLLKLK